MSKRSNDFSLPLAKKSLATPPSTPQKSRIRDISNILTNTTNNKNNASRKLSFITPPTTPTKAKQSSIYSKAKALFQRSSAQDYNPNDVIGGGSALIGRLEEANFLNAFLMESIDLKKSSSLYISGPPGTGKTAQVNISFKFIQAKYPESVKVIKINCMSVFKPENIFHEIYCQLDTSRQSVEYGRKKTSKDMLDYLESPSNKGQTVVLLLDELDYLITKDQQILFQLFNLVSLKLHTKIIIVSISNALDLTDKFLPRLKSNNLSPEALQFFPYTSDQIKDVCTYKLKSLLKKRVDIEDKENNNSEDAVPEGFIPIIHPAALQLCCRKSASVTGDLRKAFDICYKGIEMLEGELRRKQENVVFTAATAPKVLISHIAKVCTSSFGENIQTRLGNLNLLQKALLCSLLNLQSKKITGEVNSASSGRSNKTSNTISVNQFFDHYVTKTSQISEGLLGTLKKGEFLEIVSALESGSFVTIQAHTTNHSSHNNSIQHSTGNFEISNKLIHTNVLYIDIMKMVQDVRILEQILNYT